MTMCADGHGQTHVRVAPVVKPLQVYFSNQSRMDIKKEPSSPVALQRTDKESRINHVCKYTIQNYFKLSGSNVSLTGS